MSSRVCRRHKRARKAVRELEEKKVQLVTNPGFMKRTRYAPVPRAVPPSPDQKWPPKWIPGVGRLAVLQARVNAPEAPKCAGKVRRERPLRPLPAHQTLVTAASPKGLSSAQRERGVRPGKGAESHQGPKVDPSVDGS